MKHLEREIREAYIFLRKNNTDISSEALEFMKDAAIEKLKGEEFFKAANYFFYSAAARLAADPTNLLSNKDFEDTVEGYRKLIEQTK